MASLVDSGLAANATENERSSDVDLDLSTVENLVVFDENGEAVRVGDIYKNHKTILILVRHFLCYVCKEYVDDLALVPDKYLLDAGVRLVVIGCAQHKFIPSFRKTTGYSQLMYVDPDRNLYRALGCSEKLKTFFTNPKDSQHVKSGLVSGVLQSVIRTVKSGEMQGDVNQQGGSFIIGPGNTVHFAHRDIVSVSHTPINDLLNIVGVPLVNFEKDSRATNVT